MKMNIEETKKTLAVLTVAYPQLADDKAVARVNLWTALFADEPFQLVYTAAQHYIVTDTKGFPPTIGKLKEICHTLTDARHGDWSDGWGQVRKAISKYGVWDRAAAMESMDTTTAEAVRRIGWEDICASGNIEATRAQFRQTYELIDKQRHERACIPVKIQNQITNLKMLKGETK